MLTNLCHKRVFCVQFFFFTIINIKSFKVSWTGRMLSVPTKNDWLHGIKSTYSFSIKLWNPFFLPRPYFDYQHTIWGFKNQKYLPKNFIQLGCVWSFLNTRKNQRLFVLGGPKVAREGVKLNLWDYFFHRSISKTKLADVKKFQVWVVWRFFK